MRVSLIIVITFSSIIQFTCQTNAYQFPGANLENSLFIRHSISPTIISKNKIKTITESSIYGKTIYHFNKIGNIIKNESFENIKHKYKPYSKSIIEYDRNNHVSSLKVTNSKNQFLYQFNSKYNKNGLLLKHKGYYYKKGKPIDSSLIFTDSISQKYYFVTSAESDYRCKLNFKNEILTYKSSLSDDSIAITYKKDTTFKVFWFTSLIKNEFIVGKKETYYKNLLIDEKTYNKIHENLLEIHRTYHYDNLNRLTFITKNDYIKDKTIFLYHSHGLLYEKIERLNEMEFTVTKYNYTFW